MLGVSPVAAIARAFALAGALAGLAGAIMTAAYGAVGYGLSATLTLKALAAAVVGGIGSLPGAFLGGLVIGAVEAGWSAVFPIDDRDIAVYALLVVFIALRPTGLLGARDAYARRFPNAGLDLPPASHILAARSGRLGPEVLMSNFYAATPAQSLRADALAGVRTRRIVAVCFDLVIVSVLVALFWIASVVLTLGLALFFLPPLFPIVAFFYNGLTVSGAADGDAGHARDGPRDAHARERRARPVHQRRGAGGAVLRELVLPADVPRVAGRLGEALPARHPRRRRDRAPRCETRAASEHCR